MMIITAEIRTSRVRDIRSIAARRAGEIRIILPQAGPSSRSPWNWKIIPGTGSLPRVDQHIPQGFHLFESAARAERDATERVVGDRDRETGGMPYHQIEVGEQ